MDYREAVKDACLAILGVEDDADKLIIAADAIMAAYKAGRTAQPREVQHQEVVAFCEAHGLKVVQIDSDAIAEYLASRGEVTVSAESWRKFQAWQQSSSVDLNEELDGLLADKRRMDYIRKHAHRLVNGDGFWVGCSVVSNEVDDWLDAAIKQEAAGPSTEQLERCQRWLMQNRTSWPKSCQTCKFGPCVCGIEHKKKETE